MPDRMDQIQRQVHAALGRAISDVAESALQEANETVPIETGALMRSGFAEVDRDSLRSQVAYDTEYAVVQHEDTELEHDPGRRAKWLTLTFDENQRDYREHVADALRRIVR